MNTIFTADFLGATSNQHASGNFRISVVDYTHKVSEEWHFHDKVHISSIIKGGNLESRKTGDTQVKPGRLMTYNEGEIHRNRFTAHPSRNLNIEFESHFFSDDLCFSYLRPDEEANLSFLNIYFELQLNDIHSTQSIEQTVKSLFWYDRYDHSGTWVSQLKELLNDRWNEFPSLESLSNELRIHPVTISKYFSRASGVTLSEYMRKLKVKRAVDFLLNSSIPLAEIAFSCGFSDQSHMNRLVKKYLGFTPATIRASA